MTQSELLNILSQSPDYPLTYDEWYSFLSTYPTPAAISLSVTTPYAYHIQDIVTHNYPTYGLTSLQSLALYYYLHNLDFSKDDEKHKNLKFSLLFLGLRNQTDPGENHALPNFNNISTDDIISLQQIFD